MYLVSKLYVSKRSLRHLAVDGYVCMHTINAYDT